MDIYPILRDVQTRIPGFLNAKVAFQRNWLKLRRKPFEPEFEVLKHLNFEPGEVALDIGANRGQSINAIRLFQPALPIRAFEPNAALADDLNARLGDDKQLEVLCLGLSDEASEQTLYMPIYRGFMYDGLSSFDLNEAAGWLSEGTLAGFDPKKLEVREMSCVAKTLDELGLCPGFVKMDVQGFEPNVLRGGEQTLKTHNPLILLETNPDADAILVGWGWTPYAWLDGRLRANKRGDNNTLYLSGPGRDRFDPLTFAD